MIQINSYEVKQETFGDGTLKCDISEIDRLLENDALIREAITISWEYDNDTELFTLISLNDYIIEKYPRITRYLFMPYVPNARQDRYVSNRLFTLKSFVKIINSLNFHKVTICDPHSDVTTALIDRVRIKDLDLDLYNEVFEENIIDRERFAVMFPDAGAAKKYKLPDEDWCKPTSIIIGNKHRTDEGRIDSYQLLNFKEGTKFVIIRDDICSYGGTFAAAADELRKHGVERIYLIVSHCENNILKGDVLNKVDGVYTTDSIFTGEHEKIHIVKKFRR